MSDDESFVILGSSPMPSLNDASEDNVDSIKSNFESLKNRQLEENKTPETSMTNSNITEKANENLSNVESTASSFKSKIGQQSSLKQNPINEENNIKQNGISQCNKISTNGTASSICSQKSDLAASFILGEVDANVLKTSVFSQFPSLCSMEACAEDVVKLQNFMAEYMELKETLAKVNSTMKQFYDRTQQWREEAQRLKQQLDGCQAQIVLLRNENLELKRDMNTKMEHINLCDELRKKDHDELMRSLSEKTSIIDNMREQIDKLEQQQLASYEYIPKNENDSKEKPDYVDRTEHILAIKQFERQMSELLAENLDLKDVQNHYVDEITCLKVNLVSAEELIKQFRADINILNAKDIEKSEIFTKYENDRAEMKSEIALLRQQIDIYSKDFEMERNARENIAGEKEQLLQDLRSLQRKNQELIEEEQKRLQELEHFRTRLQTHTNVDNSYTSNATSDVTASTSLASFTKNIEQRPIRALPSTSRESTPKKVEHVLCCPLCSKEFKELTVLQQHVNLCLDKHVSS